VSVAPKRRRVNLPAPRINQYYGTVSDHGTTSEKRAARTQPAAGDLESEIAALNRALRNRANELDAAERHIAQLEEKLFKLKEASRELKRLKREKQALRKSPERRIGQVLLAPYRLPQKLFRAFWLRRHGANHSALASNEALGYQRWFERHRAKPEELKAMRAEAAAFTYRPLISVITPVFNPPIRWLQQTIESVLAQAYDNWELILVDDASTDADVPCFLEKIAARDSRIRVFRRAQNGGTSAASNDAVEQARGEWLGLLDHDDVLEPDALFHLVRTLQKIPDADMVYSDEDKLAETGLERPQFKPDWSPDLFTCCNYISHFTVLRRALVECVGRFRSECDGAQDYDLLLRVVEQTDRVHHIPRVLYHWRRSASSSAMDVRQKAGQFDAARRAIEQHLGRTGVSAHVAIDWPTHTFRIERELNVAQKISIIVPVLGAEAQVARWLERVRAKTAYPDYEILVVENRAGDAQFPSHVRRITFPRPSSAAAMSNFAARRTDSPWLLFLSNDVEPMNEDWLAAMAEHIQRPEIGAVGARLLNLDGAIQHAGVVLGVNGLAAGACAELEVEHSGANRPAQLTRNCSAVSAASLLTRRDLFVRCGGFDEDPRLAAFADVDLCLKMRRAGYLIVYTPFATLRRHNPTEGRTDPSAAEMMWQRWGEVLEQDPYYNPNLSRARADFSLGN
jgi:O-antigen biosynthesis protein